MAMFWFSDETHKADCIMLIRVAFAGGRPECIKEDSHERVSFDALHAFRMRPMISGGGSGVGASGGSPS